jgi:hypothetical protein
VIRGEETPRAGLTLSQQEEKREDRNIEVYYSCRQNATREINEIPNVSSGMDGHTWGARGIRILADDLKEVKPQVTKIYMLGDSRTILQAFKAGEIPLNEWFANHQWEVNDCIKVLREHRSSVGQGEVRLQCGRHS